jgi:hypothetical protein
MDSMATNHASAGDLDDDMRDASFEPDDHFLTGDGTLGPEMLELVDTSIPDDPSPTTHYVEHIPDLLTPPYANDYDRDSPLLGAASQSLGGYSLNEVLHDQQPPNISPEQAEGQEMQEFQGTSPFVNQPEANGKVPGNQNWVSLDDTVESPIDPHRMFELGGPGR